MFSFQLPPKRSQDTEYLEEKQYLEQAMILRSLSKFQLEALEVLIFWWNAKPSSAVCCKVQRQQASESKKVEKELGLKNINRAYLGEYENVRQYWCCIAITWIFVKCIATGGAEHNA